MARQGGKGGERLRDGWMSGMMVNWMLTCRVGASCVKLCAVLMSTVSFGVGIDDTTPMDVFIKTLPLKENRAFSEADDLG